jgi:pimeloyl-ACP methyl ester carboxylesterase
MLIAAAVCAQPPAPSATGLATALRTYFVASDARGPELQQVLQLAKGRERELIDMLRSKTYLLPHDALRRSGRIDADHRFVETPDQANPALFFGPASSGTLRPLFVYVPDFVDTKPVIPELETHGIGKDRYVFVVPDELRRNQYLSTPAELERHTRSLRDLLLHHPIDPDRVYMVGDGRGGHATWDCGLLRSERFAGIYPCNGGLVHEGGYAVTAGVFVENGKDLTIFTEFTKLADHGIESCRNAEQLLRKWGARFELTEQPTPRLLGLARGAERLEPIVRTTYPRNVTKVWNRNADGAHHWLQGLERTPREWEPSDRITLRAPVPKEPAKVRQAVWASVNQQCARLHGRIEGNRILVEARGIGKVRVWFGPEWFEPDRKVTVVVNGKARPPLQPQRRLDVMLAGVHATGDTSQLFFDQVVVDVPR